MDSSQRALQIDEKLFSNSFSKFWPKTENIHTVFKRIAGLRFYPKSLMLTINGFV